MMKTWQRHALGVLLAALATAAPAVGPVRQVPVYVQPYYEAGATPDDPPVVAVAGRYDRQLASRDPQAIRAVARGIEADPALITPMTLMVLAIRSYDVGLRDEAVFWFYAAKARFSTLLEVLDMEHPALAQAREATINFAYLAGPTINGYAFCDFGKQAKARRAALQWVEDHPYEVLFADGLPAKAGDRRENLRTALGKLRADLAKESEYLAVPDNVAKLQATRSGNGAEAKYCW